MSLKHLDLLEPPVAEIFCLFPQFVNVRGNECANCTVLTAYSPVFSLHIDNWIGQERGCEFINKSTLFNEGDTQQSGTDKPVALGFRIELEFGNVGF